MIVVSIVGSSLQEQESEDVSVQAKGNPDRIAKKAEVGTRSIAVLNFNDVIVKMIIITFSW